MQTSQRSLDLFSLLRRQEFGRRRSEGGRRRRFTIETLESRALPAANVFKTLTMDGDMSDWDSVPTYFDAEGNTHDTDHDDPNDTPNPVNHPDADLLEFKVAYDSENIYFFFRAKGQIARTQFSTGPGVASGRYYAITTIDVDQNNVTGYELAEGGYYPTSNGYDVNAEVEYYNGSFNTAHYLNHGAKNQAELEQAFLEQSSGLWTSGNDGPYPAGFMTVKPGIYDTYTQWVYHNNDTLTFVRDRGPVVNGIASQAISPDGHSMETKFPLKGFLKDVNGNSIIGMGATLDISFSLEASSEFSPDGQWASNTAEPIVGFHLNAPSKDSVAVYRNGKFYTDQNNNSAWNGGNGGNNDITFNFGTAGDKPIAGDWNADGFEDVGIFRNGKWYLDLNGNRKWDGPTGGDVIYTFGAAGDIPVVGDWNRDGRDDLGVFRNGTWMLDQNGNHKFDGTAGGDAQFVFGTAGVHPVVGDWTGNGTDKVGYYSAGKFHLDQNGNRIWNGTAGGDQLFNFGTSGDIPVIGDWNDNNVADVGVYRAGKYYLDRNVNRKWDGNATNADIMFQFGTAGDIPVGGRWIRPRVLSENSPSSGIPAATAVAVSDEKQDTVKSVVSGAGGTETSTAVTTPLAGLISSVRKSHDFGASSDPQEKRQERKAERQRNRQEKREARSESEFSLIDRAFSQLLAD